MIINVTQEHIAKGLKGNSCQCPVALALNEAFEGKYVASVGALTADLYIKKDRLFVLERLASLPQEATNFIMRFDKEKFVQPFSFDIEFTRAFGATLL